MEKITLADNAKEVLVALLKEFKIATDDEAIEERLSVKDSLSEREKLWETIKNSVVKTYDEMKQREKLAIDNSCKNIDRCETCERRYRVLAKKVSEIAEKPSITHEDRLALNEAILSSSGVKIIREGHHNAASN